MYSNCVGGNETGGNFTVRRQLRNDFVKLNIILNNYLAKRPSSST